MSALLEFVKSTVAEANQSCTQCLIDYLASESPDLAASILALEAAEAVKDTSPEREEEYVTALQDFLTRVTEMAVYTAELMRRPGVGWTDESIETDWPPAVISLN